MNTPDNIAALNIDENQCAVCKATPVSYVNVPCRCLKFCRKCAFKLGTGGKCKKCQEMYTNMAKYYRKWRIWVEKTSTTEHELCYIIYISIISQKDRRSNVSQTGGPGVVSWIVVKHGRMSNDDPHRLTWRRDFGEQIGGTRCESQKVPKQSPK